MYTLILTVRTPAGVHMHSIPGFTSKAAADAAGDKWASQVGGGLATATAVSVLVA